MGVTRKEVEHIAHLANLSLSSEEMQRYQDQLSNIIQYFDTLQKLPAEQITQSWIGPKDQLSLREDKHRSSLPAARALGNARETKNQQFVVPRVIESE